MTKIEKQNNVQLAAPSERIFAWLIDAILIALVVNAIRFTAGLSLQFRLHDGTADSATTELFVTAGTIFLSTSYFVLMNSYASGTLGKIILDLKIVPIESLNFDEEDESSLLEYQPKPLGLGIGMRRTLNLVAVNTAALASMVLVYIFPTLPDYFLWTLADNIVPVIDFFIIGILSVFYLFSSSLCHRTVMDDYAQTLVVKRYRITL